MEFRATTHEDYAFNFSRITVILGANGSGKSTLLRSIKDFFQSVYVEGGRTIQIQDTIHLTRQNFNKYQNLDQTIKNYQNKRKHKIVDRIFDAFMVLIQKERILKDNHSDAVVKWDEGGRDGDFPIRLQPPLEKLFEQINEIFPNLTFSYNKTDGRIVVHKEGKGEYGPSSLSDGEKQVFSLLADMLELEDIYTVVVVDEPELNLHPELAERLWTLLESEYPDKTFVYATHSIQFALRSNVETLYILSSDPMNIQKIEGISNIERIDLEHFLGGIPGILNATNVVVTEGHEKSFDSIFYRWILNDKSIEIFPCGNCNDVIQVVKKSGIWQKISSDINLIGVIDCDFKTQTQLAELARDSIVYLKFHEAESYVCLPKVIVDAAACIGSQNPLPTISEIEDIILKKLEQQKLIIALKRCFSESTMTVRMSLERSQLLKANSVSAALDLMSKKSTEEIQKAAEAMSIEQFESKLNSEMQAIELVLMDKDIEKALLYIPGKELLQCLVPRTGCKNGTDLMRSIKRNLIFTNYKIFEQLNNELIR